ncbi:MAG: hypothetical protein IPK59_03665 [Rhodospirillaceae bacterium]|nr:hypothetical protein [Rhodospirillaceae bacterium]
MLTEVLPAASSFIVPVITRMGAPIWRDSTKKNSTAATSMTIALPITTRSVQDRAESISALAAAELAAMAADNSWLAASSFSVSVSPAPVTSMARASLTVDGWRISFNCDVTGPSRHSFTAAPMESSWVSRACSPWALATASASSVSKVSLKVW